MEPSSVSHEGDDIQTYFTPNQTHNPTVAAAAAEEREKEERWFSHPGSHFSERRDERMRKKARRAR